MKNTHMKIKALIIGLSALNFVSAQDIHFSQMGYSPLTLNPALAGANYDLQVNANYRSQWNSVAEPFQTVAVSSDTRLNFGKSRRKKAHLAVGLDFFNDRAGETRIVTNNVNLNVAAHVIVGEGHTIGAGLRAGWGQRTFDPSAGRWGSQYNGQYHDPLVNSGELFNSASFSIFDIGAGLIYTYNSTQKNIKLLNVGFAAYHLNRPGYSFISQPEERMYIRYATFVSTSIGIPNSKFLIEPAVYFNHQGNTREILFGTYARYILKGESKITDFVQRTTIALGVFCRNKDALIAKMQVEWNGIGFGVAYDFNLFNSLMTMSKSRGGMEFSLRWIVSDLYKKTKQIR